MAAEGHLSEWGRNVRAALILADQSVNEIARELNISGKTLQRTLRGERMPRDWETSRLAQLLGLPEDFLREGIRYLREPAEPLEGRLEQDLALLGAKLDEIRALQARTLTLLEADDLDHLADDVGKPEPGRV